MMAKAETDLTLPEGMRFIAPRIVTALRQRAPLPQETDLLSRFP
jgi:hypothetical protein